MNRDSEHAKRGVIARRESLPPAVSSAGTGYEYDLAWCDDGWFGGDWRPRREKNVAAAHLIEPGVGINSTNGYQGSLECFLEIFDIIVLLAELVG